jgi:hypothetical protein
MGTNKELEDLFAGEENPKIRTQRLFEENAPFAAAAIIDLVHNATSDSIRLRSAQYVVDRVLGPLGREEQQDVLQEFLKGIEGMANGSSGR